MQMGSANTSDIYARRGCALPSGLRLAKRFAAGWMRRALQGALACGWLLILAGCGGAENGNPVSFPLQTLSGSVHYLGQPQPLTDVYAICSDGGGGAREYFFKTNEKGLFHKAINTAKAPCMLSVRIGVSASYLYGYASTLGTATTANVNELSDAVLVAMLRNSHPLAGANGNPGLLTQLNLSLSRGEDRHQWTALANYLSEQTPMGDIDRMPSGEVDPAQQWIMQTLSEGSRMLLNELADAGITSNLLRIQLLGGARLRSVEGTQGAEILDTETGRVWQRCAVGMVWKAQACEGTPRTLLWSEVDSVVSAMPRSLVFGARPWRLPDFYELESLSLSSTSPLDGLGSAWFPTLSKDWTWAHTPDVTPGTVADVIHLGNGRWRGGLPTDQFQVWLVR